VIFTKPDKKNRPLDYETPRPRRRFFDPVGVSLLLVGAAVFLTHYVTYWLSLYEVKVQPITRMTLTSSILSCTKALCCIAAAVLIRLRRAGQSQDLRRPLAIIAAALWLLGAATLMELRTGSWWKPWWLLWWKSVCLVAILWALIHIVRNSKR
jgi:hypothetical protein